MKPLLGMVDKAGVVRFSDTSLQNAREFLRRAGLTSSINGWDGNGFTGLIEFFAGKWHATYWHTNVNKAVA